MMDAETKQAVHAALTRYKPATVRAYDGGVAVVGPLTRPRRATFEVPDRRRRFPAVLDWLDALDAARGGRGWERLELVQATGEVRPYLRPAPAPVELEAVRLPDGPGPGQVEVMPAPPGRCPTCGGGASADPVGMAGQLVAMFLNSHERLLALTMDRDRSGVREAFRAQVGFTRELGSAYRGLGQVYREREEVARATAEEETEAAREAVETALAKLREGGEPAAEGALGDLERAVKLLPQLAPALQLIAPLLKGILPPGIAGGGS